MAASGNSEGFPQAVGNAIDGVRNEVGRQTAVGALSVLGSGAFKTVAALALAAAAATALAGGMLGLTGALQVVEPIGFGLQRVVDPNPGFLGGAWASVKELFSMHFSGTGGLSTFGAASLGTLGLAGLSKGAYDVFSEQRQGAQELEHAQERVQKQAMQMELEQAIQRLREMGPPAPPAPTPPFAPDSPFADPAKDEALNRDTGQVAPPNEAGGPAEGKSADHFRRQHPSRHGNGEDSHASIVKSRRDGPHGTTEICV